MRLYNYVPPIQAIIWKGDNLREIQDKLGQALVNTTTANRNILFVNSTVGRNECYIGELVVVDKQKGWVRVMSESELNSEFLFVHDTEVLEDVMTSSLSSDIDQMETIAEEEHKKGSTIKIETSKKTTKKEEN